MTRTVSGLSHEEGAHRSVGEETVDVPVTARMNLGAAAVVAGIAVLAMVLAARMPNPGDLSSHPGLLPALTGASLLMMAIGLAVSAIRAGALERPPTGEPSALGVAGSDSESRRTFVLVGMVVGYVILLDVVSFEVGLPLGGIELRIGSFEAVSAPMLALTLRVFWKAAWGRCAAVGTVVVVTMAAIFRYGFVILLPGS